MELSSSNVQVLLDEDVMVESATGEVEVDVEVFLAIEAYAISDGTLSEVKPAPPGHLQSNQISI